MTQSRRHHAPKKTRICAVRKERAEARLRGALRFKKAQELTSCQPAAAPALVTTLYPLTPRQKQMKAMAFMKAIGFSHEWNAGGYAAVTFGGASFVLPEDAARQWTAMKRPIFDVEDLDAYWADLHTRNLPACFPGTRIDAPKFYASGRAVQITDADGTVWHIRQKR